MNNVMNIGVQALSDEELERILEAWRTFDRLISAGGAFARNARQPSGPYTAYDVQMEISTRRMQRAARAAKE